MKSTGFRVALGLWIGLLAVGLTWYFMSTQPVFQMNLGRKHRLAIMLSENDRGGTSLSITYDAPPRVGLFTTGNQDIPARIDELQFQSVTTADGRLICVFDSLGIGFLLLYDVSTGDLWDTTREQQEWPGGWLGSGVEVWEENFRLLKREAPAIPYESLPTVR